MRLAALTALSRLSGLARLAALLTLSLLASLLALLTLLLLSLLTLLAAGQLLHLPLQLFGFAAKHFLLPTLLEALLILPLLLLGQFLLTASQFL